MAKEELPRGQLSNIILSTLIESDKYGYEIIDTIKEKTDGALIVKQPSLYSCLRRMEEQNLISSYWRDSDIGGRRHYYSITDYGKKYAERWQPDLASYNKFNQTKTQDQSQPTILQQANLFSTSFTTETKEENVQEEKNNNSFVQFDLFTSPTLISEPNDEVFDTIKELRQSADDEQTISQKNDLSLLRNSTQSEIQTEYFADNHNTKVNNVSESQIKKTFFEFSKKQKSFASTLKESPNSIKFSDVVSESKTEVDKQEFEKAPVINKTEPFSINLNTSTNKENNLEEKPAIVKSTTEFKESYEFEQEETTDNSTFEFIDLNNLDFDNNSNKTDLSSEQFFEPKVEEDLNVIQPIVNDEQVFSEQQPSSTFTPKDDAVYITEKTNFENLPKVKKIAPARFEEFARNNNSVFDEKITKLYHKNNEQQQVYDEPEPIVEELHTEEQEPINNSHNDFEALKAYYKNHNIKFGVYEKYEKLVNSSQENKFVNKNLLNLYTSGFALLITILQSIIMFCCCKTLQPVWNWLYLVIPFAFAGLTTYNIIVYFKNGSNPVLKSNYFNNSWINKLVISIVSILMIFSINLICGMNFENIASYLTTFLYLSLISVNLILFPLINVFVIKLNFVNIK